MDLPLLPFVAVIEKGVDMRTRGTTHSPWEGQWLAHTQASATSLQHTHLIKKTCDSVGPLIQISIQTIRRLT